MKRLFSTRGLGLAISLIVAFSSCGGLRGQSAAYDSPAGYYAVANGKTGPTLENALHGVIAPHTVLSYTPGVWSALEVLDADPADPANSVILIYSGLSDLISNEDHTGTAAAGAWNREHLWCQSFFGDDPKIMTDVFNLRPIDDHVNSTRGNLPYDVTTLPGSHLAAAPGSSYDSDSWEPRDADKGVIARTLFYMAVAYDGTAGSVSTRKLTLSDTINLSTLTFGKLSTLLAWNRKYPVTDGERRRNQLIYNTFQHNRNPFIDDRYWVDQIFAGAASPQQAWLNVQFTAAELADPSFVGDNANPAGDGISNLLKYAFNLPAKASGVRGLPVAGVAQANGIAYLTLSHYKNRQATDVNFNYQTSSDLVNWSSVNPSLLATAHVDADATDLVTVGVPASGSSQFLRVAITKP